MHDYLNLQAGLDRRLRKMGTFLRWELKLGGDSSATFSRTFVSRGKDKMSASDTV